MLRIDRGAGKDAKRLEKQGRFVNKEVTLMRPRHDKKQSGRPQRDTRRPPRDRQRPAGKPSGQPAAVPPKPPSGGHFLWGRHAVLAAIANAERRIAALYATKDAASELGRAIEALPADRRTDIPAPTISDRRRLDALQPGGDGDKAVHQGMAAAVWPLDAPDLEDLLAVAGRAPVRLLLLDQLSDPRNVGAIMRSALALGATAIISTHRNAPDESGALARAAAGALEKIPMIRVVNLARAIERLQEAGIEVAGLAADGETPVDTLAQIPRLAIALGAEGAGLRHLTRRHCDRLARIDISEDSESLNVSIAAAIALYAARQS